MDYKDCPHYKNAEAKYQEYQSLVEQAKKEITDGMQSLFAEPDKAIKSLAVQIENAAELRAMIMLATKEALQYPRLQTKRSREGNDSYVLNPIHENLRVMKSTYSAMLRDLGFRANTEKVETSLNNAQNQTPSGTDSGSPADAFVRKVLEGIR